MTSKVKLRTLFTEGWLGGTLRIERGLVGVVAQALVLTVLPKPSSVVDL